MLSTNLINKFLNASFLVIFLVTINSYVYSMSLLENIWVDEGSGTLNACVISESSYSSTIHNLSVNAVMTSPYGRNFSASSSGVSYARSDVSIYGAEGEEGDYTLDVSFNGTCTHYLGSHVILVDWRRILPGGFSLVSYAATQIFTINGAQAYEKVTPCLGVCGPSGETIKWAPSGSPHESCYTEIHLWWKIFGTPYCSTVGPGRMHNSLCICSY